MPDLRKTMDALAAAERLERMGVVIRSVELREDAQRLRSFAVNGNRSMRRAAARSRRRKGSR